MMYLIASKLGRQRPVEFGRSSRCRWECVADFVLVDVNPQIGHRNTIPLAQSETVLSVDHLLDDLRAPDLGRIAVSRHSWAETTQTALWVLFRQTKMSITALVTTISLAIGLFIQKGKSYLAPRFTFTRFDFSFCTLQEQERPSGQSGRRDPRGSQEQVGGRPPSGRQSLEVPSVASPVYPASQISHSSPVVWSRQFMQTPESGSHSLEWPLQLQGSQSPK